jgi:hypothetical protein
VGTAPVTLPDLDEPYALDPGAVADGARASEPSGPYQEFDLRMWLRDTAPGEVAAGPLNPRLS